MVRRRCFSLFCLAGVMINDLSLSRYDIRLASHDIFCWRKIWNDIRSSSYAKRISSHEVRYHPEGISPVPIRNGYHYKKALATCKCLFVDVILVRKYCAPIWSITSLLKILYDKKPHFVNSFPEKCIKNRSGISVLQIPLQFLFNLKTAFQNNDNSVICHHSYVFNQTSDCPIIVF